MISNKANHINNNDEASHAISIQIPYNVKQEMKNYNGSYRSNKSSNIKRQYPDLSKINEPLPKSQPNPGANEVSINCQKMLTDQYKHEREVQELINQLDNDVDLSNVTLAPEDEKSNSNNKIQEVGVTIDNDKKKSKPKIEKKRSYIYANDDFSWKCCCKYCCMCFCIVFIIVFVATVIIMGYFFYPILPAVSVIDVTYPEGNVFNNTLLALKSYNDYHSQIQRFISFQNLDFTFDFNVTFSVESANLYDFNFTDVQVEVKKKKKKNFFFFFL